ncbi:DUF2813 domain-containing protein [Plesiomonas sp.]|uniref:DUF2813 domain-containing protein n=1 Tax=Plesiomonas sp. TaxID=2486279 RepID=UPI003F2DD82B
MFLERIEIVGFRGINRLSLLLDENTVLIGENAWGKSSLLDALSLLLAPADTLYRFKASDFYHPPGEEQAKERHLHIVFTFRELTSGHWQQAHYAPFQAAWVSPRNDKLQRLHFRLEGEWCDDRSVSTWRNFIDEQGKPLHLGNIEPLIHQLIRLHPVLRLRDARLVRNQKAKSEPTPPNTQKHTDRQRTRPLSRYDRARRYLLQRRSRQIHTDFIESKTVPSEGGIVNKNENAAIAAFHTDHQTDQQANNFMGDAEHAAHPFDISGELSQHIYKTLSDKLTHNLQDNPQRITNKEIREGLDAARQLLEHYFTEHSTSPTVARRRRSPDLTLHNSWQSLDILRGLAQRPENRTIRLLLLGMFASILHAKGIESLDPNAKPLLIVEDPETRLHPIMLSVAWGLLSELPLQRLTTTNSGELLSYVPVDRVCRLVRHSSRVSAYRILPSMLSREDSRRIAFHIRLNRASSLFARCWLLVEGETEVWLLTELARLAGYHLQSEGIKIIEFAQCGLKPLIKFANAMGIEWHVLTDGDDAGKKYAATVRGFLRTSSSRNPFTSYPANNHEFNSDKKSKNESLTSSERENLTFLPVADMELYLFHAGFAHVYYQVARLPENIPLSPRRVIDKAIHRTSKPDMALAIVEEAERMGTESIPKLLRQMFSKVVWLARGRAG